MIHTFLYSCRWYTLACSSSSLLHSERTFPRITDGRGFLLVLFFSCCLRPPLLPLLLLVRLFMLTAHGLFPYNISDGILHSILMSPKLLYCKLRMKSRFNIRSLVSWCCSVSHPNSGCRQVHTISAMRSSLKTSIISSFTQV